MQLSPLRPDLDEKLKNFFVQPKLTVVQVSREVPGAKELKGKDVLTYKDVFEIGIPTNIYVQGNPGMGKSTYCTKLTLDWCECFADHDNFQAIAERKYTSGLNFDFLFLVSLRETNDKTCEVFKMVKNAIINQLLFRRKYDNSFLSEVLDTERCLIILDGLDEWAHSKTGSCEMPSEEIPHRCALSKCVYLTMTRPWKLNQICLKDSEIDVLLEISGVRKPEELITKVIGSLNSSEGISRDASRFITATRHLSGLTSIPVISMLLVCLWFDNERLSDSQCGIYCKTVKMKLERQKTGSLSEEQSSTDTMPNCFRNMKWLESEINILKHLGKLAFETLFPEDGHSSQVVFSDEIVSRHLKKEMKMTALSAGLLTEYKIRSLNEKRSQLSFLHKTIQEFLAAFYLSINTDINKTLISRVKIQSESINDISQLFIFLCGMAPTLATSVSQILMSATTCLLNKRQLNEIFYTVKASEEAYTNFFSKNIIVKNTTEIINAGYTECKQNGHDDVCLEITHLYFDRDYKENKIYQLEEKLIQQNVNKIETIWCQHPDFYQKALIILNSSSVTITALCLPYVDKSVDLNMCRYLQAFTIPYSEDNMARPAAYQDMSKCQLLKYILIQQANLALNINTDQLHYCVLWYCDLSQGEFVETLTKRNSKLRYLDLGDCRFPRAKSGERSFHLDLTSCSSLVRLGIYCDISVSVNTTNLQRYVLRNIDLSQGNLLEALNNSTQLEWLRLWCCYYPLRVGKHDKKVFIDISACTNLRKIEVRDSDVIVKYNNVVIGKHQTLWEKR